MPRSRDSIYYYANGKKVPLTIDESLIAIRPAEAEHPGDIADPGPTRGGHTSSDSKPPGREIGQGYVLAAISDVGPVDPLSGDAPVRQTVFRSSDDTIIVPLPEVRIAADDVVMKEITTWLAGQPDVRVDVDRSTHGQLTARPTDGSGVSAIRLANEVHLRFHPTLAQPRFIRIAQR